MNNFDHKVGNQDQKEGETVRLPQYRSHKIVQAAKIIGISPWGVGEGMGANLLVEMPFEKDGSEGIGTFELSTKAGYYNKHKPTIGGYYVLYPDGYESFSPAKPFEEGYTRYKPLKPQIGGQT